MNNLKTGDLVLFESHSGNCLMRSFDNIIRWWTGEPYSHCGIIIVDPPWEQKTNKRNVFVWDSSLHDIADPIDKKIKFGVALVPFEHYYKSGDILYIRKPENTLIYNYFSDEFLEQIYNQVYHDPYDIRPGVWLEGMLQIPTYTTDTTTFWCSAFLQYILTSAGILQKTSIRPSPGDFAYDRDGKTCKWIHKYKKEVKF